jgi:peptidyl-Lys metalloendopeptidase
MFLLSILLTTWATATGASASQAFDKRATFIGCSSISQSQLLAAATTANSYIADSKSYLTSHNATTLRPRYTMWFGAYSTGRYTTVLNHFTNMAKKDITTYKFDCTCTDNAEAYVYPDTYVITHPSFMASDHRSFEHILIVCFSAGQIYLCNLYWGLPKSGTDSQAGVLVRVISELLVNGGLSNTYPSVDDQSSAQALAASSPASAVFSPLNHQYFAENNPPLN